MNNSFQKRELGSNIKVILDVKDDELSFEDYAYTNVKKLSIWGDCGGGGGGGGSDCGGSV